MDRRPAGDLSVTSQWTGSDATGNPAADGA